MLNVILFHLNDYNQRQFQQVIFVRNARHRRSKNLYFNVRSSHLSVPFSRMSIYPFLFPGWASFSGFFQEAVCVHRTDTFFPGRYMCSPNRYLFSRKIMCSPNKYLFPGIFFRKSSNIKAISRMIPPSPSEQIFQIKVSVTAFVNHYWSRSTAMSVISSTCQRLDTINCSTTCDLL